MKHKITAPVEGFSGSVVGVSFDDGHAETDNAAAVAYFRRHGYTVESASGGDGKPLNKWTVAELKAYAEEQDIDLGEASKKGEILEAIAADAARDGAGTPGDPSGDGDSDNDED